MRKIEDQETVELDIQVNGDFTQNEANELKNFIARKIIGRNVDYLYLLKGYCEEKGFRLEENGSSIIINK